ncbi:MAG TPA: hemerythrin domain-containing protein [Myxococcota bacterium]|jgi:hypothetical protein|nr:hemerythrin domain-containing protein [Myxococcota bacterium]
MHHHGAMCPDPLEQPGLRLRLGTEHRRISSQHRQLDTLYASVTAAVERQSLPEARSAFLRFRDAWDAHTGLEDTFYFPALHGLRPDLVTPLVTFCDEHARFRDVLTEVEHAFEREELAVAATMLESLISNIAEHERREEELARDLGLEGKKGLPP